MTSSVLIQSLHLFKVDCSLLLGGQRRSTAPLCMLHDPANSRHLCCGGVPVSAWNLPVAGAATGGLKGLGFVMLKGSKEACSALHKNRLTDGLNKNEQNHRGMGRFNKLFQAFFKPRNLKYRKIACRFLAEVSTKILLPESGCFELQDRDLRSFALLGCQIKQFAVLTSGPRGIEVRWPFL